MDYPLALNIQKESILLNDQCSIASLKVATLPSDRYAEVCIGVSDKFVSFSDRDRYKHENGDDLFVNQHARLGKSRIGTASDKDEASRLYRLINFLY